MIRKYQGYIAREEQNWIQASWAKHFFFLAFYGFGFFLMVISLSYFFKKLKYIWPTSTFNHCTMTHTLSQCQWELSMSFL